MIRIQFQSINIYYSNILIIQQYKEFNYITSVMAEQKSPEKEKKVYTYQDLIKFSNMEIYSAFGEVKDSKKPSAPKYSFGTSVRNAQPKKYTSKEMAIIDCFGKDTPKGPNYDVTDKFLYHKGPQWKVGTMIRNTLDTKAKYEHYFRKDVDFDVNEADKVRRYKIGDTRFGGDARFPIDQKKYKMTPGPQYLPNLRPEIPQAPHYSLYARRAVKGFDPLIQLNSTSQIVGPGSYHPQNSMKTGKIINPPNWSVPKGPRDPSHKNRWQLNQTYDTTSSVGIQARSDKISKPKFSVGKSQRENPSGIFKAHMQYKPYPVRIDHPKF